MFLKGLKLKEVGSEGALLNSAPGALCLRRREAVG